MVFTFFEKLINPYPKLNQGEKLAQPPQAQFFAFLRFSLHGTGWHYVGLLALSALIAILEASLFGFLGHVIDWLSGLKPGNILNQTSQQLINMIAIFFSLFFLNALNTLVKNQVLSNNFPMRLRWVYHHLMLKQSMRFFSNEFSGSITHKVVQTVSAVRQLLDVLSGTLVTLVVYFSSLLFFVSSFHPVLLIPLMMWLLLYIISMVVYIPRLGAISKRQAADRALMHGRISDAYTNISTIKLFAHTQRESAYVRKAMEESLVSAYQLARKVSTVDIFNEFLNIALITSTLTLSLWLWNQGHVTTGAVAAALAMTIRLKSMAYAMMREMVGLSDNIGVICDGMYMFSRGSLVLDAPDAKDLKVSQGEIAFKNVCFAYEKSIKKQADTTSKHSNVPVLTDLNLTIQAGEKIGLVGYSGAGKSTIVNLLLRFYDLQSGSICIDGQNIQTVTQDSLRQAIGVVTQDTSLLHRSIRENIMYGKLNATEEEMIQAAKRAHAQEFIHSLHDQKDRRGYDSQVGERGVKLSGGQRQRLAIARVILKNAPILLLDEASSALDSEVEALIQENLNQLMEGKTVIAIAHRLSTIAAMDRLIVLEKGNIVEQGSHTELLAKNGLYSRLWSRQSGGFLGDQE